MRQSAGRKDRGNTIIEEKYVMAKKICPKCGTTNIEDSVFCEKCGNRLAGVDSAAPVSGAPVAVKKKAGSKTAIIAAAAVVSILAIAGCVFAITHFLLKEPVEIDLVQGFDDTVLELSGEDGSGSINGFDESAIKEKLYYYDQTQDAQELIDSVIETGNYRTEQIEATDLRNGDKVKIVCTYSEEFAENHNLKIKNGNNGQVEKTITIGSLPNAQYEPDTESYDTEDESSTSDVSHTKIAEYVANEDDEKIREVIQNQFLTEEDVNKIDNIDDAQRLCNYFYTLHGFKLSKKASEADREYFNSMEWYNPTTTDQEEASAEFNSYEKANEKVAADRRNNLREYKYE